MGEWNNWSCLHIQDQKIQTQTNKEEDFETIKFWNYKYKPMQYEIQYKINIHDECNIFIPTWVFL